MSSNVCRSLPTIVTAIAGTFLLFPCTALADQEVQWQQIVGIIQAGNTVGSGTGKVTGGGQPWFDLRGSAAVDLNTGDVQFQVRGLVFAGGNAIGTPDGVTQVKGTLVCDTTGSATGNSTLVDTGLVTLSAQGNARFSGRLGPLPSACLTSPDLAFLIRTASGNWIAAGEVRELASQNQNNQGQNGQN